MPTGDRYTVFADKRNLPQQRLKDTFFDYLYQNILNVMSRVWAGQRGIFGTTSLSSGGTDRVQLNEVEALDGDGNVLVFNSANGYVGPYYFENENAIDYSIGARFAATPRGVVRNPRTNVVTYDTMEEIVGETADPNGTGGSVITEAAGQLTIKVDSVFEDGVSNAGRTVTVYLKNPISSVEAVAIERGLVVAWDGTNNTITTADLLGQTSGNASTDPADYTVIAEGATIRRNTDLSVTDPYAFIGTVTGGGAGNPPTGFSVVGQIDVTGGLADSLQSAYVNGRVINPTPGEGGDVRIESTNVGGTYRAGLVIKRIGSDGNEDQSACLYTVQDIDSGVAVGHLMPIKDYVTTDLQESEAADSSATNTLTLSRGGVDLTGAAPIHAGYDLALLEGFTTLDGLYQVDAVTATSVDLVELGGGTPASWPVETGVVRFLRPRLLGYGHSGFRGATMDGWEMHGGPGQAPFSTDGKSGVLQLFPWEHEASLVVRDDTGDVRGRFTAYGDLELERRLWLKDIDNPTGSTQWQVRVDTDDQVVLTNANFISQNFAVRRESATRMFAYLTNFGISTAQNQKLRIGDELCFGIPDATDLLDDLGMRISRNSGVIEDNFSIFIGQMNNNEGVNVKAGADNVTDRGTHIIGTSKLYVDTIEPETGDLVIQAPSEGDIDINANANLNINADANLGGSGDLTMKGDSWSLEATGAAGSGLIQCAAEMIIQSTGGDISLNSGNEINIQDPLNLTGGVLRQSAGDLTIISTGEIDIVANSTTSLSALKLRTTTSQIRGMGLLAAGALDNGSSVYYNQTSGYWVIPTGEYVTFMFSDHPVELTDIGSLVFLCLSTSGTDTVVANVMMYDRTLIGSSYSSLASGSASISTVNWTNVVVNVGAQTLNKWNQGLAGRISCPAGITSLKVRPFPYFEFTHTNHLAWT